MAVTYRSLSIRRLQRRLLNPKFLEPKAQNLKLRTEGLSLALRTEDRTALP